MTRDQKLGWLDGADREYDFIMRMLELGEKVSQEDMELVEKYERLVSEVAEEE